MNYVGRDAQPTITGQRKDDTEQRTGHGINIIQQIVGQASRLSSVILNNVYLRFSWWFRIKKSVYEKSL